MTLILTKQANDKLDRIKRQGNSKLHIITDFDKTLTPAFVEGNKYQSTFAYLRNDKYLGEEYEREARKLFDKYYPIEHDNNLEAHIKDLRMQEWWIKHLQLKIKHKMSKQIIEELLEKGVVRLREHSNKLFEICKQHSIPLLIFSAGIGSIIEEYLKSENLLTENVHIVSNIYDYDEQGFVQGYQGPVVHSHNKNEQHIKATSYFDQIKERPNVIIIGDGIGDAKMAESLEHETVLKIGLLNGNNDAKEQYQKEFDIIETSDSNFKEIVETIKNVLE